MTAVSSTLSWMPEAWANYTDYQRSHPALHAEFNRLLDAVAAGTLRTPTAHQLQGGGLAYPHVVELPGGGQEYLLVWTPGPVKPHILYLGPTLT